MNTLPITKSITVAQAETIFNEESLGLWLAVHDCLNNRGRVNVMKLRRVLANGYKPNSMPGVTEVVHRILAERGVGLTLQAFTY